jgi:hypothetical protein
MGYAGMQPARGFAELMDWVGCAATEPQSMDRMGLSRISEDLSQGKRKYIGGLLHHDVLV